MARFNAVADRYLNIPLIQNLGYNFGMGFSQKVRFLRQFMTRRIVLVTIFYTAITFVSFYPLSTKIFSHIHDNYDSLFLLWTFSWYKHAIFSDPINILNSNALYPDSMTLAYSNLMVSKVPIFLLFDLITQNNLAAYNLTIASSFIVAGVAFFLLAYYLTKNTVAAAIGGIIYSFSPIKMGRISLAQVLNLEFFPLAILFSEKYFKEKRRRYLVPLFFFSAAQILSEGYIAIIFSIMFGLYLILRFKNRLLDRQFIVGGIIMSAVVLPFYSPYIYLAKDRPEIFKKEIVRTITLSLRPNSFWTLSSEMGSNLTSKLFPIMGRGRPDASAYFGILPLTLLVIYLLNVPHRTKIIWITIFFASLALAFGPYYILPNNQPIKLPYYYLWRIFPLLGQIRSPGRFSLAAVLPLAIASAMALHYLLTRYKKSTYKRALLMGIVIAALFVDNAFIPFPHERLTPIPRVYYEINKFPKGAIFEFPFHTDDDFLIDKYNYFSTANFYPIVMAYSSNYSTTFHHFKRLEQDNALLTKATPDTLKDIKAKYVFVHDDKLNSQDAITFINTIEESGYRFLSKVDSTYIYHYPGF